MDTLKQVLMNRDGMTEEEAQEEINRAREELHDRIDSGEMPFDFMEEEFGLEPDYLMDLM